MMRNYQSLRVDRVRSLMLFIIKMSSLTVWVTGSEKDFHIISSMLATEYLITYSFSYIFVQAHVMGTFRDWNHLFPTEWCNTIHVTYCFLRKVNTFAFPLVFSPDDKIIREYNNSLELMNRVRRNLVLYILVHNGVDWLVEDLWRCAAWRDDVTNGNGTGSVVRKDGGTLPRRLKYSFRFNFQRS